MQFDCITERPHYDGKMENFAVLHANLGTPSSVFPAEHLLSTHSSVLAEIHRLEVNLAIWKRSAPACPGAVGEILRKARQSWQLAFERGDPPELISAILDEDLDLQSEDSRFFYEDIQLLASLFLEATGARKIGIRLERLETDACRLFHVDHVEARLLTTYSGRSTLWLRNEHVIRTGLGKWDDSLVVRAGAQPETTAAGWVLLMKGESGNAGRGLVHKSPAIEAFGEERIILRMDNLG